MRYEDSRYSRWTPRRPRIAYKRRIGPFMRFGTQSPETGLVGDSRSIVEDGGNLHNSEWSVWFSALLRMRPEKPTEIYLVALFTLWIMCIIRTVRVMLGGAEKQGRIVAETLLRIFGPAVFVVGLTCNTEPWYTGGTIKNGVARCSQHPATPDPKCCRSNIRAGDILPCCPRGRQGELATTHGPAICLPGGAT